LSFVQLFPDHNPNFFPEPEKYIPSRWYGISEHDVSVFGAGPRACIGRKFSQIESLTFLALFLRNWKVDVALSDGETRQEYEERVMGRAGSVGLAFGIGEISLRLTKRKA
jgi:cytochrome P450